MKCVFLCIWLQKNFQTVCNFRNYLIKNKHFYWVIVKIAQNSRWKFWIPALHLLIESDPKYPLISFQSSLSFVKIKNCKTISIFNFSFNCVYSKTWVLKESLNYEEKPYYFIRRSIFGFNRCYCFRTKKSLEFRYL